MTRVDLAILGGGCAGLSLVHSLIDKGYQGTVVVVEPRTDYTHDRTWAFWQLARHKWSALVQTSWTRWALSEATEKMFKVATTTDIRSLTPMLLQPC